MEPLGNVILEVEPWMVLKVESQRVARLGDSEIAMEIYIIILRDVIHNYQTLARGRAL